jgi:hypothetical protein
MRIEVYPAARPTVTVSTLEELTAFGPRPSPLIPGSAFELALPPASDGIAFDPPLRPWGTVDDALAVWLDEWLLFRGSTAWLRRDDVPSSSERVLTGPWRQCVNELTAGAQWTAATCWTAHGHAVRQRLADWGDYATALVVATATDVHIVQSGLWTD